MTTRRAMNIDEIREKLLLATLLHVPFDGWSDAAIRAGAEDAGLSPAEALNAFPAGPAEALALFRQANPAVATGLLFPSQSSMALS